MKVFQDIDAILSRLNGMGGAFAELMRRERVFFASVFPEDGLVVFDRGAQELLGVGPVCAVRDVLRLIDRPYRRLLVERVATGQVHDSVEVSASHAAGQRSLRIAMTPDAQSGGVSLMVQDLTDERGMIEQLRVERDHLRHTVELNPQLPWLADPAGNVIAFTERYEKLTGRTQEDLVGNGWELVLHPDDLESAGGAIATSLGTGQPLDMRVRMRMADGSYRWFRATCYPLRNDAGEIIRWFGYTEDIDDYVLIEQRIRWTAEHDALTKLPNRAVFNHKLERAIFEESRLGQKVAILLADVDNFKDVNDVLGHDAGDALLRAFADLIGRVLPDGALLARIGGDEFAIILPFEGAISEVQQLSDRIFAALKDPVAINGHSVECRISIGASVFPFHGQSPTELFKNADIALYEAKARGRGQMTLFSLEMKQETQRRVAMINLGRKAVETDSIIPFYQMQMDLMTNRPLGFEALLRRRDRQGRICAPASIAAAFEDAGVAEALGDAMLKAVLSDMRRARDMGVDMGAMSVNFSTAEFRNPSFAERLSNRVADAGIDFRSFVIEVTESVFLGRQVDNVAETIRKLDKAGFRIALDDFGTGYASLVHLRQLPVDTLKIDKSFVRNLADSRDDLAIVSAIINLGASLDLKIIAEGIETEAQLAILRGLNLHYGQGFLFAHPMPFKDACTLALAAQNGASHSWSGALLAGVN
ncbi:putative bifunctional diguanylate cyclase/phosphodiesterase [Sphingomonas sp. C3-2]|uniref:putative bifunctional diguanylate cyclase/phosphodiesterase n=1 Tax=Sphingomonas sp. C3-2 TaxID=3062169 RepID=UPI00294B439F|nr:EAL domain-containing protein [Sphingomonas sp. C3-2]WOK35687.1 EAL domain-containing protein [Sphingomonas sp. C3-2]